MAHTKPDPNRARVAGSSVPGASDENRLQSLEALSRLLDTAFTIPGTSFRIGLDGLLGLIPGIGDPLGTMLSSYVIFAAARLGAPKRLLVRMVGNVLVETIVGAVPIIGDLFDIAWKANARNVALLRAHQSELGSGTGRSSRQILWLLAVVLLSIIVAAIFGTIFLLRLVYQFITS